MSGRAAAAPFPRVLLFLRPVLRHVFLFYFPLMTSLLDRSLCCSPQREAAEKHTDWGGGRPERQRADSRLYEE